MTSRHPNGFRFTDEFIHRWERILVTALIGLTGLGFALGLATDIDGSPSWLGAVAVVLIVAGVVGPLLAGAILGGESIRRGGGVIGVLLTVGLIGGASGQAFGIDWLMIGGGIVLALGVIGFWAIGWIAKVPMYIGLPWAHGKVVQRTDSAPRDLIGGDDPRLRPRRRRGGSASRDPRR